MSSVDFFFFMYLWEPYNWPKWLRRTFVLTIPVSLPLWIGVMAITLLGMLVAIALLWPIEVLERIWNGEEK